MKNKIKYVVIAGSSGGHILPAIKLINKLSNHDNIENILFVTNEVGKKYLHKIVSSDLKVLQINSSNKISFIFHCLTKIIPIFFRNKKINLIGFGGFISTPILYLSKVFNFIFFSSNRIFIHEQNIIFGLANKFNYFIADKVFTSFPSKKLMNKEIYVGNFFSDISIKKSQENPSIKILLLGGSAGSLELNNIMLDKIKTMNVSKLSDINLSVQIPLSHFENFKSKYLDITERVEFFSYDENLIFSDYDLIISRSGSGSLNDILYRTDNVFFIPHPHSRDKHQYHNLEYFKNNKMSLNKLEIPHKKTFIDPLYFNELINPFSIDKIICYLIR